jgi:hypothetical protein
MFPGHVRRSLFTTTFRYCAYYRVTKGFTLLSKKKKSKKKFIFYYRVTIVFTPTVFTTLQHAAEVGCVWACVSTLTLSLPTQLVLCSLPAPRTFLPPSLTPSLLSLSLSAASSSPVQVLDVGAGFGGCARFVATRAPAGAMVTALELQVLLMCC